MNNHPPFSRDETKIILALIISSTLPLLDGSIVNVILPKLGKVFNVTDSDIQWVVTSYFLASIVGLLASGPLQGKSGAKTVWLISGLSFAVGSLMATFSYSFTTMLASRTIQGIGAGMLLPLSQAILAEQFGKERMRVAMGMVAIPAVFAPAIGPVIGAVFSEYLSWRLLFFINIPLGVFSIFIGKKYLVNGQILGGEFPVFPFVLLSVSMVCFFYSIDVLKDSSTPYRTLLLAGASVLVIIALAANARANNKVLNFAGFSKLNYSLSIFMGLAVSFLFYSFMIFYPLSVTDTESNNVVLIGSMLGLQGVGAWMGRKYLHRLTENCSPFSVISTGIFLSTLSLLLFGYGIVLEGVGFLIRGVGLGIATIACLSAPMQWTERENIKDTSVITRFSQLIGAVCGGIFSGYIIYLIKRSTLTTHQGFIVFFTCSALILLVMIIAARVALADKKSAVR